MNTCWKHKILYFLRHGLEIEHIMSSFVVKEAENILILLSPLFFFFFRVNF